MWETLEADRKRKWLEMVAKFPGLTPDTQKRTLVARYVHERMAPNLTVYDQAAPAQKNRLLLDWLSDDAHRAKLFRLVNDGCGGMLDFPSRDASPRERSDLGPGDKRPAPVTEHKIVRLITARKKLESIISD